MIEDSQSLFFIVFLSVLFLSTTIHEVCHALTAKYFGDTLAESMGRISLNPLRHIDPFLTVIFPAMLLLLGATPILAAKPVPINTLRLRGGDMSMALVGLAGPFSNIVLAAVAGYLLRVFAFDGLTADILVIFARINISLFVFNMIPFPPLDGSRLLYAFAPYSVQRQMEKIESLGIFTILLFLMLLAPLISPVVSNVTTAISGVLLP